MAFSRTGAPLRLDVGGEGTYSPPLIRMHVEEGAGRGWRSIMARRCELTGKGVMVGNNVSHANNKTRRRFLPNLVDVTLMSEVLDRKVKLRVAASTLRTVEHQGGLDKFLLKADTSGLSDRISRLKREVVAASAGEGAATAAPAGAADPSQPGASQPAV